MPQHLRLRKAVEQTVKSKFKSELSLTEKNNFPEDTVVPTVIPNVINSGDNSLWKTGENSITQNRQSFGAVCTQHQNALDIAGTAGAGDE